MFDVFYTGPKPNRFEFEQEAGSINHAAELSRTKFFWYIYGGNDYTDFNFDWCPPPWEETHVHVFPSQWQRDAGVYFGNKHTAHALQWHYRDEQQVKRVTTDDIFFIDAGNVDADDRFAKIKRQYPNAQKVRYANSMFETIKRCATRASTPDFWVTHSHLVYDNFNFTWYPDHSQQGLLHVFPSQWNKWSDTFLINKSHFQQQAQWHSQIEQFANLNFVEDQYVQTADDTFDIYYVDHGNTHNSLLGLKDRYPRLRTTRFVDNYLDTFKRIVNTATSEYIWITSSICDYSDFDFTWKPEPWQMEMIHVFPSGFERRGDTFYVNVEMFKKQMVDLELLDWFNVINYCDDQQVHRFPVPHHYYTGDDLVSAVKAHQFEHPYTVFSLHQDVTIHPNMCLWSKKDRIAERFTASGCVSVIPRDAKSEIRTQIYDYPHINTKNLSYLCDNPLDIVYISNGEPDADKWYYHLCNMLAREDSGYPSLLYTNTIKRVSNVNGRVAAYKAAAEASNTPWFFAVFAKLEVSSDFDWNWQPDYWQEPKHYIFHARNPVNGLEYGHQAMIAYNKRLVLETTESGLDFTLTKAHEVVPILSGTAHFNQSPWMTWRTAFREVLKLRQFSEQTDTMETRHRLRAWLNKADGEYAEWCLRGAQDAVEFYESVNGDPTELQYSFEWDWLQTYFSQRYSTS